jgi:endonuclease III
MVAFQRLKEVCPTWKSFLATDVNIIEDAIRCGGLADIKVFHAILQ